MKERMLDINPQFLTFDKFDRAVMFFLSKRGYAHILSMNQLIFVFFFIFLTSNSTPQLGPDLPSVWLRQQEIWVGD